MMEISKQIEEFPSKNPFVNFEQEEGSDLAIILKEWTLQIPKKKNSKEKIHEFYLRLDENYKNMMVSIYNHGT